MSYDQGLQARRGSALMSGISATLYGVAISLTDRLSPAWRYGYVQPVLRRVCPARDLRRVSELDPSAIDNPAPEMPDAAPTLTCVLGSDRLDIGGIGSVVEMLAEALPMHGVRPVVVCHADGKRAQRMRQKGIEVISVLDDASAREALASVSPDVIQLHSASPSIERAAIEHGAPLVTVLHNTEIHYTADQWRRFSHLLDRTATAVAVSEVVRDFHIQHVGEQYRGRFTVVPNGAPSRLRPTPEQIADARDRVGAAIGVHLGSSVVYLCLARYDSQKNISGMVASFIEAIDADGAEDVRLIVAGEPSDPLEYRRADALRRASGHPHRVHLLGNSYAPLLLQASDIFLLDSFFEGWPVAATEAAATGLPLVISEVGGAAELVQSDPRSVLVPNATGPAADVTDRAVAQLRRRSRRQPNLDAITTAIRRTAIRVRSDRRADVAAPSSPFTVERMASEHARVLLGAASPA